MLEEPFDDFDPWVDERIDETMRRKIAKIVVKANPQLIAAHGSFKEVEIESEITYFSEHHLQELAGYGCGHSAR